MAQKSPKSSRLPDSSLKKAPLPPLPFAAHLIPSSKESQSSPSHLQETVKMIDEYKKKHQEMEKELDEIYKNTGMSSSQVHTYLEDSTHFSKEEWEHIQQQRLSLLSSFISVKEFEKRSEKFKTSFLHSSSSEKTKRRKTKPNRRNWISLR